MARNLELTGQLAREYESRTSVTVEIIKGPTDATERLSQYLQYLAAGSSGIDIYQIDVIWPATLAEHFMDLREAFAGETGEFFESIVQNNTVNGQLVCIPWFADTGVLYYRTDLLNKYGLSVPSTWDDLTTMASLIQKGEREAGNPDFWGYVWQGKAYEGLTCNALEWQVSAAGGTIVAPEGTVTVNNPETAGALDRARGWVGTISPPGVLTYQEEEARNLFQSGNAAFMRNWPYAYALGVAEGSPIRGRFELTSLPSGTGGKAAALGGWQLGVAKYSRNPGLAVGFVKLLTSAEAQKRRAIDAALLPTRPSLYGDPDVAAALPFIASMKDPLANAMPRPALQTGMLYNQVSSEYFRAVHRMLSKQVPVPEGLALLEAKLSGVMGGRR
jgi:trehalose/maltose transport system substrate-binding protein